MIRVYLDESYDWNREYFLMGALFTAQSKSVHRKMSRIKEQYGYLTGPNESKEIKYSTIKSQQRLDYAKDIVGVFMETESWFRCVVVRAGTSSPEHYGQEYERDAIKAARMYKRFAERLIQFNSTGLENGILLTDRMTRCRGDDFLGKLREVFCEPDCGHCSGRAVPIFRHIDEVDSSLHQYQVIQMCDILLGCVLNENAPTTGKKGIFKGDLREHLKGQLGVETFGGSYWGNLQKLYVDKHHFKFSIWYWDPTKGKA